MRNHQFTITEDTKKILSLFHENKHLIFDLKPSISKTLSCLPLAPILISD